MALELKIGRTTMKVVHVEDNRTTVWELDGGAGDGEILRTFRSVVAFVDAQVHSDTVQAHRILAGWVEDPNLPPLPVRTPKASQPPILGANLAANGWEVYDAEKLEEAP